MKANRLFIACVASLSLAACGGGTELNAVLSGAAEKPTAVTTQGSGNAKVTIEDKKLKVEGTFTNLSGNATAAHIHGFADANGTANPICNLSAQAATSGTLSEGTGAGSCGALELTDDQIAEFEAGKAYVNIHTGANPGGEIRGQLTK
jgi:hypothetical protein